MTFQVTKGASRNIRRAALLAAAAFGFSSPAFAGPTPCTSDGTTWTCTLDQSAGIFITTPPPKLDVHGLTTAIAPAPGVSGIVFGQNVAVPGSDGRSVVVTTDLGTLGISATGANGINVESETANGAAGANGILPGASGADGQAGGKGGDISLTNKGNVTVTGGVGLLGFSLAGNGGAGGNGQSDLISGGNGGMGGAGGAGGSITITNTGSLDVTGSSSVGILAQSLAGRGGAGGAGGSALLIPGAPGATGASGVAGNIVINQTGNIVTHGGLSAGVFLQTTGAGGASTVGSTGSIDIFGVGAAGIRTKAFGVADNIGDVTLSTAIAGGITTHDASAIGILTTSEGIAGMDGIAVVGAGTTGGAGQAGNASGAIVSNHSGTVLTLGDNARAIQADSTGGDGGKGGTATGANTTGGSGGNGGNAGPVSLTNSSALTTMGAGSQAISVRSQGGRGGDPGVGDTLPGSGGPGGNGGAIHIVNNGALATSGGSAHGIFAQSDAGLTGAGPGTASQGNGGVITILNAADITTGGSNADAIVARSSGQNASSIEILQSAGLIATSGASAFGITASSTAEEIAGDVTVTLRGSIDAAGANAIAVQTQSSGSATGNGNITVLADNGSVLSGGTGTGAAVRFNDGNNNLLTNKGTVTTRQGLAGNTVIGGAHNEVIENFGTYIGGASLGGGSNAFNNRAGGVLALGANLDLGAVTNVLTNQGTLSPGGANTVFTGGVNGKLVQTAAGTYALDLDIGNNIADRVNATGTADVAGKLTIHPTNVAHFTPGAHQVTILHADGGLTDSGLTLTNANTAVVNYSLSRPNAKDEALNYAVDLTPTGLALSDNQVAVADNIGAILAAGSTPAFDPVAERLFNIPTGAALSDFYADILSEPYIAPAVSTMFAADGLNNSMMSCRAQDGGPFRFSAEGECSWFQMAPRRITRESNTPGLNSSEDLVSVNAGHQVAVSEHVRLGLAVGYQNSDVEVGSLTSVGNRGMGGLVVKYVSDPILAGLAISGGFAKNDSTRFVFGSRATSRQSAAFTGARARFAVQLLGEDNFYLRPMVDFNGGIAWVDGFREKGAGPLNLVVSDKQYAYVNVAPAVEIGGEIPVYADAVMRPFVRVGMAEILSGDKQDLAAQFEGAPAGVSPFINRATLDRTVMTLDVGADLLNAGRVAARVDYAMQFGSRTMSHGITLKLSTTW